MIQFIPALSETDKKINKSSDGNSTYFQIPQCANIFDSSNPVVTLLQVKERLWFFWNIYEKIIIKIKR